MPIQVLQVEAERVRTTWQRTLMTMPDVQAVTVVNINRDSLVDAADILEGPEKNCFLRTDEILGEVAAFARGKVPR